MMIVTRRVASLLLTCSTPAVAQHDHPATPPQTLSQWAEGAQLFSGLGTFHRAVTTRSPLAQRYFDQGMRFVWAFNHDEATRSFARAATIDPHCASCFWGVALTLGPNYNMPMMNDARVRVARDALAHARANAGRATPAERALIGALERRYGNATAIDPGNGPALAKDYVVAMRAVAQRYPRDADIQTLFAEALMNTNPWKLWNPDGTPGPGTPEILGRLQAVLRQNPRHPGANHYWIHAIEASRHPERALPSAVVLEGMMPAAGHLEHMPAHIMQRVGRYAEAEEANRKGAAADLAYIGRTAPPDYYPMYLIHNYQFLATSAAMAGRRAETIAALRHALGHMPESMLVAMPGFDWSAGFLYDGLVRFGLWQQMLDEPAPSPKLVGQTISYLQSRAVALAAMSRVADARAAAGQAARLMAGVPVDATQGFNAARTLYDIGQMKAEARIAAAQRHPDESIALLRKAVAMEDGLSYNEPSDLFFPVRHWLGAQLLEAGRAPDAEQVYRDDLARNPENGWALFGLAEALRREGRPAAALAVDRRFAATWNRADVKLASSAF